MKILVRILAASLLLLLVAAGALLLLLPPIARSEAVQSRLKEIARDATGRDVSWSDLDVGLLPPRLRVEGPRIATAGVEGADALSDFDADEIALVVALRPLLGGSIVVDRVSIRGARTTLVRHAAGIAHPFEAPAAGASPEPAQPESSESGPTAPADAGQPTQPSDADSAAAVDPSPGARSEELAFDVRDVVLESSELRWVDQTLDPPVTWVLSDISGTARGELVRGQIAFEANARVEGGGRIAIEGQSHRDGRAEAELELGAFALASIQPYLGAEARVAGTVSGRASFERGAGDTVTTQLRIEDAKIESAGVEAVGVIDVRIEPVLLQEPLRVDLRIDLVSGTLRSEDVVLEGPARLRASQIALEGPLQADLELDASAATLRSGDAFAKPAGVAATLEGPLTETRDGFTLGPARVVLGETRMAFTASTGARLTARIEPARIDLDALGAHLPGIREAGASGTVVVEALEIRTEPLSVKGALTLDPLRVARSDAPEAVMTGEVRGTGDGLHAPDLRVQLAGQEIRLDAKLLGLAGELRHEIGIRADGVDSQALIRAFDPGHDTLSGRLDLTGRVRGPLADDPLAAIAGNIRFAIAPGRLKNVSILKLAFDDLATGAAAAAVAGRGGDLGRYQEDEFERLGGSIALSGGRARTEDLQLIYRHYSVDLRGTVGLVDQALDLTGEITIDPEIDAALAGDPDPAAKAGRKRVFPLARVGGTIESPKVTLGDDAVLRFASAYIRDERRRRKWEGEIDERLGEGSGKAVLDVLDEVLRGGSR